MSGGGTAALCRSHVVESTNGSVLLTPYDDLSRDSKKGRNDTNSKAPLSHGERRRIRKL